MLLRSDELESLISSSRWITGALVLEAMAAVALVVIVRGIHQRQDALHAAQADERWRHEAA